jgi:hypothetical protein
VIRRGLIPVLAATLGLLVSVPAATGGASSVGGGSFYVVRPDPRLCPSPLCGGYWIARASFARMRCHDGALRPRCYVARAVDENRGAFGVPLADGSLVRGGIEPKAFSGFGRLGVLVAADVHAPVGKSVKGAYFRVRDLGIRCVQVPCYHLRAARLNRSSRTIVSSLDLVSLPQPTPKELARAEAALRTPNGLLLVGRVVETSDAGTILQASRIYLRAG